MASLQQIFGWFSRGLFPTQDQYKQTFSSFWHRSERLPIEQILGLQEEIDKVTTKFKGYHTTLAELQAEYPQADNKKDYFAWVGTPYPGTVWKVYADGGAWTDTGEVPTQEEIDLAEYAKKEELTPIQEDLTDILGDGGSGSSEEIILTWQNGYYIDLNGTIQGGGTNALYKLSAPISVQSGKSYKATLRAGNLLAVSGWTGGVFNNSLAIVGKDTDNPAEYTFTIPSGVTDIRLTCRVELAGPKLIKYENSTNGRLPIVEQDVSTLKPDVAAVKDAIFIEKNTNWADVDLSWQNGYYVDLNGVVSGGGTNTLYKLTVPISVQSGESYKAILQAGNLLAVSGWSGGVFNNSLAMVGKDTNNPAEYAFTIPSGVTEIRLTCRVELVSSKLSKYTNNGSVEYVNRIDLIEAQINKVVDYKSTIATFADFVGNTSLTGNNTIAGGGLFQYPTNIAIEDLDFVAKIKVISDNSEFGLCRYEIGRGTALVVKKQKAEIRLINSNVGTVIYSYDLPFSIEAGQDCIIRMYKQNKDIYFAIITDKNIFVGFAERSDSKDLGRNWGNPSVFCLNGQIEIKDTFLRKSSFESPLTFCVGDSFIEGWGVVDNLDKRYIALMQDATNGNVEISGRGGETTTSLLARFDIELAKMNSDYILLAIGTNDSNLATYKTNMSNLIGKVKASNKIPILVTITPRSGFPIVDMNSYVRNSNELYIDMNHAVNNGNETSWNPLYVNSDNVHPNIAGNAEMFKRMLFDIYSFFDTRILFDIYKV